MSSFEDLPPAVQDYISENSGDGTWRGPLFDYLCEACGYSSWEELRSTNCFEEYRCLVCNRTGTLTFRNDGSLRDLEGCITHRAQLDGWKCAECGDNDWMVTDCAVPPRYNRHYKHYTKGYECLSCGAQAHSVWDARTSSQSSSRHRMCGAVTRVNDN